MFDIKELEKIIGMNKKQALRWASKNRLVVTIFEKTENRETWDLGQEIDDGEDYDWRDFARVVIDNNGLVISYSMND